jgi:hypothetical protein
MTGDTERLIAETIDAAEGVRDPLDHLIEKAATDSGAAFTPEALNRLATLKKDDRAAFESLRAELKRAGCRVTELDKALSEGSGGRGPTQSDILLDVAASAELFHTPDRTGFADIDINGHRETWPVRAKGFRRWLVRRFFEATQGAPSSEALQSVLSVIQARADFDAPERIVHVRVGEFGGKSYLDLCDETWRAVEIDTQGWRVIDKPPVRFRRAAGMRPLPIPMRGGSVEELRPFINVHSYDDFVLVIAYLLAALRPRGPYPVIALSGEHGSAKSTLCAMLRGLIDPNTAPMRSLPREDLDLFIAANNSHVLAFDNVSGLPPWTSDTLCRLSTGGGFAVRQLYTDQDEMLFDAVRPVILNGIEEVITKPDLADRTLFMTLEPIPEENRRTEQELWAAFETARPRILGALLDAVGRGLDMLPHIRLENLPRMADFALWVTACETSLWPAGTFGAAYRGNRDTSVEAVLEADLVAVALRAFMADRPEWTGTATELLEALGAKVGEPQKRSKQWPGSAGVLAGRLRRLATFLRKVGIKIDFSRGGHANARRIQVSRAPENGWKEPSALSASSDIALKSNGGNGFMAHPTRAVSSHADDGVDQGGAG